MRELRIEIMRLNRAEKWLLASGETLPATSSLDDV